MQYLDGLKTICIIQMISHVLGCSPHSCWGWTSLGQLFKNSKMSEGRDSGWWSFFEDYATISREKHLAIGSERPFENSSDPFPSKILGFEVSDGFESSRPTRSLGSIPCATWIGELFGFETVRAATLPPGGWTFGGAVSGCTGGGARKGHLPSLRPRHHRGQRPAALHDLLVFAGAQWQPEPLVRRHAGDAPLGAQGIRPSDGADLGAHGGSVECRGIDESGRGGVDQTKTGTNQPPDSGLWSWVSVENLWGKPNVHLVLEDS